MLTYEGQWQQYRYIANKTLNLLIRILRSPFVLCFNPKYVTFDDTRLQYQTLKTMHASYSLLKRMAVRMGMAESLWSIGFVYIRAGPVRDTSRAYYSLAYTRMSIRILRKLYKKCETKAPIAKLTLYAFLLNRLNWTLQGLLQHIWG